MPLPNQPIMELALLEVKPGREQEFEAAFGSAQQIIAGMPGYLEHSLRRSMENPGRYVLLVKWATLEDHTEGFRGSAQYQEWRKQLHHFYDPFPEVEHYRLVHGSSFRAGG